MYYDNTTKEYQPEDIEDELNISQNGPG